MKEVKSSSLVQAQSKKYEKNYQNEIFCALLDVLITMDASKLNHADPPRLFQKQRPSKPTLRHSRSLVEERGFEENGCGK